MGDSPSYLDNLLREAYSFHVFEVIENMTLLATVCVISLV